MARGWSVCNSSAPMPPINMEGRSECTRRATPSGGRYDSAGSVDIRTGGRPSPMARRSRPERSARAGAPSPWRRRRGTVAMAPPRAPAFTTGVSVGTRRVSHGGAGWQSAGMRVVVFGAGAIGGLVGARLFQHGVDVTLVARGAPAEALASGLVLETPDESVTLPIPVVTDAAALNWTDDT